VPIASALLSAADSRFFLTLMLVTCSQCDSYRPIGPISASEHRSLPLHWLHRIRVDLDQTATTSH
jgi:hypothetical protein